MLASCRCNPWRLAPWIGRQRARGTEVRIRLNGTPERVIDCIPELKGMTDGHCQISWRGAALQEGKRGMRIGRRGRHKLLRDCGPRSALSSSLPDPRGARFRFRPFRLRPLGNAWLSSGCSSPIRAWVGSYAVIEEHMNRRHVSDDERGILLEITYDFGRQIRGLRKSFP
jgi:hypothetical protein